MGMKKMFVVAVAVFFWGFVMAGAAQDRGLVIRKADGTVLTRFTASHALVIGESEYTAGWQRLRGVTEDTAAVKRLFEEQGFTVETVENAGSGALKNGIEDFLKRYGYDENARLLVYYAGHGHTLKLQGNRDMGYIVPVDAPDPNRNRQGFLQLAITMDQFDTWAKMIDSRHVLFIFDSCFSGSVFERSRAASSFIDEKIAQPVRLFITSGSADETVPDKSIFRAQLEAALRDREADTDKDGYVTGNELGYLLESQVMNYSKNTQHPQYGKIRAMNLDKGDFVFEVGGRTTAAAAPPVPQTAPAASPPAAERYPWETPAAPEPWQSPPAAVLPELMPWQTAPNVQAEPAALPWGNIPWWRAGPDVPVTSAKLKRFEGWDTATDQGDGGKSTVRVMYSYELIDGAVREVTTFESYLSKVNRWAMLLCGTSGYLPPGIRNANGVRFKTLGDGMSWYFEVVTTAEPDDGTNQSLYRYRFTTKKGKVTVIDIPFTKLRQAEVKKRVKFIKDHIYYLMFSRHENLRAGNATLKLFDFEVY
jgi:hypothetical protein